jgi:hypothetical protein
VHVDVNVVIPYGTSGSQWAFASSYSNAFSFVFDSTQPALSNQALQGSLQQLTATSNAVVVVNVPPSINGISPPSSSSSSNSNLPLYIGIGVGGGLFVIGIVLIAVALTQLSERKKKVITSHETEVTKKTIDDSAKTKGSSVSHSEKSLRDFNDHANRSVVVNPMLQSSRREVVGEALSQTEPRELAPIPVYEIKVSDSGV